MSRIVITTDTYYPTVNGVSYFTQRLAVGLTRRGVRVIVIAPSRTMRDEHYTHQGVEIYGIPSLRVIVNKYFRFSPPLIYKRKIHNIIRTVRPEVLHIQDHFFISLAAKASAKKLHLPIVATNHFMPENFLHYLHIPKKLSVPMRKALWKQCCYELKQADVITTPTHTAARALNENGLTSEVLPISCGIDLTQFKSRKKTTSLLLPYHIPSGIPFFLSVGRLDKEKNIHVIVQAFAHVLKKEPAHLVIVGKGMQRKKLEQQVRELQIEHAVTFTGFVPDEKLPLMYAHAFCFVHAGTAELQSISTMEAMASGCPVIAVDAVALPELVHDNVNGFLFKTNDDVMCAKQMLELLHNPLLRERMSKASLRMIQHHSIEKTISAYEQLYCELLQNAAHSFHPF